MNTIIQQYIELGVNPLKILFTKAPSAVIYSVSRKCIVGGDTGIEPLEIIGEGLNKRLSYENNYWVYMLIRTNLTPDDVDDINNSEGIICTDALYGRKGFRYGFIPKL